MKRLPRITISLLLIIVSFSLIFVLAWLADGFVGWIYPPPPPSTEEGIIFHSGTTINFDMYDYVTTESINSMGFRDDETPIESKHQYRIIAVGDSFTYGWGVSLEDSWCKLLQHNLREREIDAEVLNLGRPAAGPVEYADIVTRAVYRLQPDLVLLGLLTADDLQQLGMDHAAHTYFPHLTRIIRGETSPQLDMRSAIPERYAGSFRNLYIETAELILARMTAEQRDRFSTLEPLVQQVFHEGRLNPWMLMHSCGAPDYFLYIREASAVRSRTRALKVILRRIRERSEAGGAKVLMLGIPEGFLVNDEAYRNVQRIGFRMEPELKTSTVLDEVVEEAAASADVPFFSATAEMRKHSDKAGLYLELDRHMAPAGNRLFADIVTPVVAGFIEKEL